MARYLMICVMAGCAALLLAGCSRPKISFTAKTEIQPNGQTGRAVVITCKAANENETPPNLTDFIRLPEVKKYQNFSPLPEGVSFSGIFASPAEVPVDFMKLTTGYDVWAQNRLRLRQNNYVLLSTFEFEERVEDIVERPEAEEALAQGVSLISEAVISGFDGCYGEQYDLSQLDEYLRKTIPELSRRLYQVLWEIRRSRRGGLDLELEVQEWDRRLRQELSNYGLYLEPLTSEEDRQLNEARAWEFLDKKLRELAIPRQPEIPPLRAEILRSTEKQQELFRQIEMSVKESFGSMEYFFKQLDPLIPVIFGAFFEQRLIFNHAEPSFTFHFQIYLPGHIMQTNGVRDIDGSIHWRFTGEDLHLTGYPMWVRSVGIDMQKAQSLGLVGFPLNLVNLDRFLKTITTSGAPDKNLIALLDKCVAQKSLAPLRAAAGEKTPTASAGNNPNTFAQRADALLKLLEEFLAANLEGKQPGPEGYDVTISPDAMGNWGQGVEIKPFDIDELISVELEQLETLPRFQLETPVAIPPVTSNSVINEKLSSPTLDVME
ncbi:MAG: hypothetical protein JXA52_03340 [Planctomycetes bacterium]|nr:hypothetical protein [Planctomycetota bacterium]